MKKLSLAQKVAVYSGIGASLVVSNGCGSKSAKERMVMFREASTVAEDIAPGIDESRIDHSLYNVVRNPRSGEYNADTSLKRLRAKREMLAREGRLTEDADITISFAAAMAEVGSAYAAEQKYMTDLRSRLVLDVDPRIEMLNDSFVPKQLIDQTCNRAREALDEVSAKNLTLGLKSKVDEARKFVEFMHNIRNMDLGVVYTNIRDEAEAESKKTGMSLKDALKKGIANFVEDLEKNASQFPYTKGIPAGHADEVHDIIARKRLDFAKWIVKYADADPAKRNDHYDLALFEFEKFAKDKPYSRLAPQSISLRGQLYRKLGLRGKAVEAFYELNKVPYRGSIVTPYAQRSIQRLTGVPK